MIWDKPPTKNYTVKQLKDEAKNELEQIKVDSNRRNVNCGKYGSNT